MSRRSSSDWALLIAPGLAVTTLGLVLQLTASWRLVRIPGLAADRSFEDLWQVTSNADCAAADPAWNPATTTCDPWQRPYNYPSIWARAFARIGLGGADTQWLGIVLILVLGGTLVALAHLTLRRAPTPAVVTVVLSAVSPPSLSAMERGNVDLLVWPWVVLALWLMSRDRWAVAAPVLGAAVLLKFFPLGALAGGLARRRRVPLVLLAALPSVLALALEADQFAVIGRSTPQVPVYSWGVSVLPLAAGLDDTLPFPPVVDGFVFFLLCLGVGLLCLRMFAAERSGTVLERVRGEVTRDPGAGTVVSASLGLVLFTYLLGANFDYRMIALTVLVMGLARSWDDPACRAAVVALVALQYLSYPLGFPWELVGDMAWAVIAPALAIFALWWWVPPLRRWVSPVPRREPAQPVATGR